MPAERAPAERGIGESAALRWLIVLLAVAIAAIMLLLPLLVVFANGLSHGLGFAAAALAAPDARAAIELTLLVAAITVPLNTIFGLCAAWSVAHFRFPCRRLLVTLIELPFAVSPVVAGLIYVLIFGLQGWFGPFLAAHDIQIIFALPGIVLATLFVTLPFVARGVIAQMEAQGVEEEEAALTLGADGWQLFRRVTLPKIRWSLLYGVLLCNARAMGEFGAVSVVSGHIRGLTNTMPLQIEILYNDYNLPAAFAVAALLAAMALATIVLRMALEWRHRRAVARGADAVWLRAA
jgi:sulfate transport system permease protein